jgi:hypothetical protein
VRYQVALRDGKIVWDGTIEDLQGCASRREAERPRRPELATP